jgi:branched-subunit amino acid transport protein
MSILVVFIVGGLLTFGMRLSFVYLLGRLAVPATLQRMLRFVAPAVLSAIVAPELLFNSSRLDLSPANERLVAGLIAILLAWWTKNTLVTILVGSAVLLGLQLLP